MKVVNRKYKEYFSLALQRGIKAPHPKTPILFASSLNRQYLCTLVVFHFLFVGSLNQQYLCILVFYLEFLTRIQDHIIKYRRQYDFASYHS